MLELPSEIVVHFEGVLASLVSTPFEGITIILFTQNGLSEYSDEKE